MNSSILLSLHKSDKSINFLAKDFFETEKSDNSRIHFSEKTLESNPKNLLKKPFCKKKIYFQLQIGFSLLNVCEQKKFSVEWPRLAPSVLKAAKSRKSCEALTQLEESKYLL